MTFTPETAAVWFEIPVSDLDASIAFYNAVLQTELKKETMGPNPTGIFPTKDESQGVAGHIYPGEPAKAGTGGTVHLAAPEGLEDAMERVRAAGGTVVSEIIEIPAGKFVYCLDLDGNSFGLFNS